MQVMVPAFRGGRQVKGTRMALNLEGKAGVITGAGKGLGRAYALALAARGARIIVNNRIRPGAEDSAAETVTDIRAAGGEAEASTVNVNDPGASKAMVDQALAAFGRLDFVISNAGMGEASNFMKQTEPAFREIFEVNFFAAADLARAALPHLAETKGRLVFSMSTAGIFGSPGMAAYSSSKAALYGLTRALAHEGVKRGVAVNAIAPYARTQMTEPFLDDAARRERLEPAHAAPCAVWLASPACSVTGEVFIAGADRVRRARFLTSEAAILSPGESDADLDAAMKALSGAECAASAPTAHEDFVSELKAL